MSDIRTLLFNKATRKMELLTTPLNRLGLDLRQSALRLPIDRLYTQLRRRGIRLRPRFYFGEDWGCVGGTANIEVAFYDADPLLRELNREFRGWAHADNVIDYLLRHETGHAFCYVHRLYKNREFRSVFDVQGGFFETYPATDRFKTQPWSRDFVNPNRDHYAQKHPDEDFAETFSVWLDPHSHWRQTYRNKKGALQKLQFVSDLVARHGEAPPQIPLEPSQDDRPVEEIRKTVAEMLGASLSRYRRRATGFIDPMLRRMGRYRAGAAPGKTILLADVITAHHGLLEEALVKNAKVTQAQAASLLSKMQSRARSLHLHVPLVALDRKLLEVTALASTLATRFALTGSILPRG